MAAGPVSNEPPPLEYSEDEEMPDMVPVTIQIGLPEFIPRALENVLAGVLLTWEEFLQLFEVTANPEEYFIRGSNGQKLDLNEKIGDYVNLFDKPRRVYPVTLERLNNVKESDPKKASRKLSTSPQGEDPKPIPGGSRSYNDSLIKKAPSLLLALNEENDLYFTPNTTRRKLIDTDTRKRKANESLEKIAQDVVQAPMIGSTPGSAQQTGVTIKRKRRAATKTRSTSSKSRTSSNEDAVGTSAQRRLSFPMQTNNSNRNGSRHEVNSVDSSFHQNKSASIAIKKAKAKWEKFESTNAEERSLEQESEESSSESEIDEAPTKDRKFLLKEYVIKYLTNEVSERSFMRVRNELMALRDQEKFMKVVSVAPITAGLLDQTFCRKLQS